MTYFLGLSHHKEWVVWDSPVPVTGDWEVIDVVWKDDDTFKLTRRFVGTVGGGVLRIDARRGQSHRIHPLRGLVCECTCVLFS